MTTWNCCRTCLGVQSLHPIFAIPEYNEEYTKVILLTTGIKIESTDILPLQICVTCINFINNSYKFRKKCEENQKMLLSRLNGGQVYEIKLESYIFKSENKNFSIDISDLIKNQKNEIEDNANNFINSIDNIQSPVIEFEPATPGIVDETLEIGEAENVPIEFELPEPRILDKPPEIINAKNKVTASGASDSCDVKTKDSLNSKEADTVNSNAAMTVDKPIEVIVSARNAEKKGERVREEIQCEYCNKILTSKLSLRNHYKIHTGFDVVCEHCGKKFITRRLLLMHCKAKHGYEKTDKCSYCEYKASNAEQVKIHERLHTGEKPYVCTSCGAGFHRNSSYLQHIAIHLPEKNIQCPQCPARFKSITLMRIHKQRHGGPHYSYKCRVCENTFVRKRNVSRHLQRVHGLEPTNEHIIRVKIP